jgi:bacteriocin-like protein
MEKRECPTSDLRQEKVAMGNSEVRKLTDKELAEVTGGYLPVRDDGTIHSPVTHGWDLKQNKKIG